MPRSQATPGLSAQERADRQRLLRMHALREKAIAQLGRAHCLHPDYQFDPKHRLVLDGVK